MPALYIIAALILLATVTAGLVRIFISPGRVEWILALQLLGSSAVAVVLLLAQGMQMPGLINLALLIGLLTSILAVAFVRYSRIGSTQEQTEND
jgi:multicomponent Na+:H+ antiporter subunit F